MQNSNTSSMAGRLSLEVISPEGQAYRGDAAEIILPTVQGEIAVLPGHAPLFAKLAEGEITVKTGEPGDEHEFIAITGGFLEVLNDKVTILADYAVRSAEIEELKAEEGRRRAEAALKAQAGKKEFALAEKELKRSILELKIAEKYRKRRTK